MEWIDKNPLAQYSLKDVTVHRDIGSYKRNTVTTIIFRNKIRDIMLEKEYIVVGIDDERLYFKESDMRHGYKVRCCGNGTNNYRTQITNVALCEWCEKYEGDFTARFDKREGLWYVDGDRP